MINTIYHSKYFGNEKSRIVLYSLTINIITQIIAMIYLGNLYGAKGIAMAFVIASVTMILPFVFIELQEKIRKIQK